MVNYKDEYTKFKLFNRFASAFRRLSAIAYGKGTGRAARNHTADDRRGIKEKTLRAWHAGVSQYQGRERCNDFSIGIELEGTDTLAYTDAQYQQLVAVTRALIDRYPDIANNMTGHCDIAPDRKTDPGPAFDWARFRALVSKETT